MPTKTKPKSKRTEKEIASLDIPQAAIEQPEDGTVGKIITEHIKVTLTGLIITGDLTYEDWLKAAEFYQFLRSRTQWIIGDMLRYGESRYGEKYAQAVDEHGKSASRLQTYVYVCGRFEIERRRPELGFDHHAECASLDPREADRVLLEAIKLRWSAADVRYEVDRINERNGTPRRGRKPKNLPISAKVDSPTLDGHVELELHKAQKPLIWNGYPLRVMTLEPDGVKIRSIWQGDFNLTPTEADQAAHHHKFAHGPALAAWLEEHNFIKGGDEPCATNERKCAPVTPPEVPTATAQSTVASNGATPSEPAPAPTPDTVLLIGGKPFVDITISPDIAKTMQAVIDGLQLDVKKLKEQREDLKIELEECKHQNGISARETQLEKELDDARDQLKRHDAHTDAQTPLQRAEEAILRFNEASKDVDWTEVGKNAARRAKWLGSESNRGLLTTSDEVIDALQSNPPAQRK